MTTDLFLFQHGKSPDYYRVHLLTIPNEAIRGTLNKGAAGGGVKNNTTYQKSVGGLLGFVWFDL